MSLIDDEVYEQTEARRADRALNHLTGLSAQVARREYAFPAEHVGRGRAHRAVHVRHDDSHAGLAICLQGARDDLAAIIADRDARIAKLESALDAIARANDPKGTCLVPTDTARGCVSWDDYSDCDCGYVDAADNLLDYARAALERP